MAKQKEKLVKKGPVTEMFTAEDMLKFAAWFSDADDIVINGMDILRDYIKQRNREKAIKEFTEEYDRKNQ